MLKYNVLSKGQKKAVNAILEARPQWRKEGVVTLKEINEVCKELAEKRESGGVKIGYPNWLFKTNKITKGVYQLPLPSKFDLEQDAKHEAQVKKFSSKTKTKTKNGSALKKIMSSEAKMDQAKKNSTKKVRGASEVPEQDEFAPVSDERLMRVVDEMIDMFEDNSSLSDLSFQTGIDFSGGY